ncbi:hypothetical protein BKA70DRAFT_1221754 [Coprinopsis sp. MPI-PUGE-AT-0042]|nr:hypothetical protein BKA70DRAFT_1221754 [Coprinopsis sp. MPI-PUGE-AT-0042]
MSRPPPPFNGAAPPIPNHLSTSINPNSWQTGFWQPNPLFNPAQQHQMMAAAAAQARGMQPGPGVPWVAANTWVQPGAQQQQQQQQRQVVNPYKRVAKPPSAEYLATKLSDNPLGLEGMDPSKSLYNASTGVVQGEAAATTPWIWQPRSLDDDSGEDTDNDEDDSEDEGPQAYQARGGSSHRAYTSKVELRPTFSSSIVRTPDFYNQRRTSQGVDDAQPLHRGSSSASASISRQSSHTSCPPASRQSSTASQDSSTSSTSLSDVSTLSDEPTSMLSPLMISNTPKPSSSTRSLATAAQAQSLTRNATLSTIHESAGSGSGGGLPRTSTMPSVGASYHRDESRPRTPPRQTQTYPSLAQSQPYPPLNYALSPPPVTNPPGLTPPGGMFSSIGQSYLQNHLHSSSNTHPTSNSAPSRSSSNEQIRPGNPSRSSSANAPSRTSSSDQVRHHHPAPSRSSSNEQARPHQSAPPSRSSTSEQQHHQPSTYPGQMSGPSLPPPKAMAVPYPTPPPNSNTSPTKPGSFSLPSNPGSRRPSSAAQGYPISSSHSPSKPSYPANGSIPPPPAIYPDSVAYMSPPVNPTRISPRHAPNSTIPPSSSYPTPSSGPGPSYTQPSSSFPPASSVHPSPPNSFGTSSYTMAPQPQLQPSPNKMSPLPGHVRKGYWNSRGDHLTASGFIVYAPWDRVNPSDLADYPPPPPEDGETPLSSSSGSDESGSEEESSEEEDDSEEDSDDEAGETGRISSTSHHNRPQSTRVAPFKPPTSSATKPSKRRMPAGYKDEFGTFVAFSARPELPESLPKQGRPPERPYDSFIQWIPSPHSAWVRAEGGAGAHTAAEVQQQQHRNTTPSRSFGAAGSGGVGETAYENQPRHAKTASAAQSAPPTALPGYLTGYPAGHGVNSRTNTPTTSSTGSNRTSTQTSSHLSRGSYGGHGGYDPAALHRVVAASTPAHASAGRDKGKGYMGHGRSG